MKQLRMRYQWFQDVPRHVSRREYQRLQLRVFLTLMCAGIAVAMVLSAVLNLPARTAKQLARLESMSIAEALAYQGERLAPVKLEGFLIADDALVMPDDPARRVVRGRLEISARRAGRARASTEDIPTPEILYSWSAIAERLFLTDGTRRIALAIDPLQLPLRDEPGQLRATLVREGTSARTSRAVAVRYADLTLPLPASLLDTTTGVIARVERQLFPNAQAVVVVMGLETGPGGPRLVDPLGERLRIYIGTEQDIRQRSAHTRLLFAVLWVPMALLGLWLGRSAHRLRQEFIERSNH